MASESIYFILLIPSEEKIDFKDLEFLSEIKPVIIYNDIKKREDSFLFQNVFKLNIKKNEKIKKKIKYQIQYVMDEYLYDILFEVKENIFIYDIRLLKSNKYIDNILKRKIDQNQIPLLYR